MQNQQKIVKIIRQTRDGISKKTGKPYQLLLVMGEAGDEIEVFGPANVGDLVTEITYNSQYDQLQGKVAKPDRNQANTEQLDRIEKMLKYLVQAQRQDAEPTKPLSPVAAKAERWKTDPPSRAIAPNEGDEDPLEFGERDYPADMLQDEDEPGY